MDTMFDEDKPKVSNSFGRIYQIRSYILHPYHLVKDLRTGVVSSNPADVLDGNLDEFLVAALEQGVDPRAEP